MKPVCRTASERWRFPVYVCLIALTAVQCRPADRPQRERTTFTVLYPGDERSWPKFPVFLELALPDETGKMQGRLAKSWEHTPDYRTWTYHIRTNVRWHDGAPVTAHDVKFTFDLIMHPDVLQRAPGSYTTSVPDDSTFVIAYEGGSIQTEPEHWPAILPKHLVQDLPPAGYEDWDFWTRPIGNGPYRYVRHVPQTFIEFEANPDYALGKPRIERLIIKFGQPSITELLSGNVDAVTHFVRADVANIKDDPRFRVYYEVWDDINGQVAIRWNQRNPLLEDRRVRRALTLAINRPELRRVLNMWANLAMLDGVYTERQYWRRELPAALPYDPEEARALLEQAGWRDGNADGIRERDGHEFRFSLLVWPLWQAAAVYVQSQLRQIGVQADIVTLEIAAMRTRMGTGQFGGAIVGFSHRASALEERVLGRMAAGGVSDGRIAGALQRAHDARDADELDAAYRGLAAIVAEELPFTFLALNVETYVAHRRVRGLSSPFRAHPIWFAEHLWIEDDR